MIPQDQLKLTVMGAAFFMGRILKINEVARQHIFDYNENEVIKPGTVLYFFGKRSICAKQYRLDSSTGSRIYDQIRNRFSALLTHAK
jgi:hypothetical protein